MNQIKALSIPEMAQVAGGEPEWRGVDDRCYCYCVNVMGIVWYKGVTKDCTTYCWKSGQDNWSCDNCRNGQCFN